MNFAHLVQITHVPLYLPSPSPFYPYPSIPNAMKKLCSTFANTQEVHCKLWSSAYCISNEQKYEAQIFFLSLLQSVILDNSIFPWWPYKREAMKFCRLIYLLCPSQPFPYHHFLTLQLLVLFKFLEESFFSNGGESTRQKVKVC